jgi:hypothetical protein
MNYRDLDEMMVAVEVEAAAILEEFERFMMADREVEGEETYGEERTIADEYSEPVQYISAEDSSIQPWG